MTNVRINGKGPVDVIINGKPVLAIMINGTMVWPAASNEDIDIDISAVLSCFGMGMWVDDFTWNDNAIWK